MDLCTPCTKLHTSVRSDAHGGVQTLTGRHRMPITRESPCITLFNALQRAWSACSKQRLEQAALLSYAATAWQGSRDCDRRSKGTAEERLFTCCLPRSRSPMSNEPDCLHTRLRRRLHRLRAFDVCYLSGSPRESQLQYGCLRSR